MALILTRSRVLAGLLPLALVGCGRGSAAASSTASASAAVAAPIPQLVAYSSCMRRNGVPNFPDPDRQGNLVISPDLRIDPGSPQYKQAVAACRKLSPEGGSGSGMTPAQHAQALAAVTRYAQCMRKHGIPMANPFSGPKGGVGFTVPAGVDPTSQRYEQADAACKHLLPSGA
jgi:hypothetical protein